MSIKEKTEGFLENLPLKEGDCLLVGVSGGKDSMVLLQTLWEIFSESYGKSSTDEIPCFSLAVAHYNHKARGEDSEDDEIFVKKFVDSLNLSTKLQKLGYHKELGDSAVWESSQREIPFFLGSSAVKNIAKEAKKGFEETARELRYGFLQETAEKISAETRKNCYIVTAHHANDNLETLLLHLARGAGLQGLSGIPPKRGRIIRPFLQVTSKEIALFVEEHHLPYREDLSNAEEQYRRNFVRHQVIDKLELLNPCAVEHSAQSISILRGENHFLNAYVGERLVIDYDETSSNRKAILDSSSLLALDESLHGRAVQYVVEQVSPSLRLSQKQREEILSLIKHKKPSGVFLLYPLRIRRSYDKMEVDTVAISNLILEKSESYFCSGETFFWGAWEVTAVKSEVPYLEGAIEKSEKIQETRDTIEFLCGDVENFSLRSRKQGDTLKISSRPRKSLKKWMIEEKIPQHLREEIPIFVTKTEELEKVVAVVDIVKQKAFVDSGFLPQERANYWHIRLKKREA